MSATDMICQAIASRHALSFRYKGGIRTVQPYILGFDDTGTLLLSAVQISGGSGMGFRTFTVDNMSFVTVSNKQFFGQHRDYNPRDRLFRHIICQIETQQ